MVILVIHWHLYMGDADCSLAKFLLLRNNDTLMLTKNDLTQIGKVIDDRLEKRLGHIETRLGHVEQRFDPIEKGIKYLKKKVNRMNKTLDLVVKNYDEGDVKLERRVSRIEHHLALPHEN